MLYDEDAANAARRNVAEIAAEFAWRRALAPLVEFCAKPVRAADAGSDRERLARRMVMPAWMPARLAARVWLLLRQGGVRVVGRRVANRLRHK